MKKELAGLGLPFTFVDAVDGRDLDPASVKGYDGLRRTRLYGSTLSANQLACALSHIDLFRRIAESEAPYSIILDDDLVFGDHFCSTLKQIPSIHIPWEHLRLGGLKKRRFVPRQILENGVSVGFYTGPVWGAEAYALTPEGAQKLLSYKDLQLYIIDQAMERFWENRLISLGVHLFQAFQLEEEQLPSNIGYTQEVEAARSRAQRKNIRRRIRRIADMMNRRRHNLTDRGIFWDPPRCLIRHQNPPKVRPSLRDVELKDETA